MTKIKSYTWLCYLFIVVVFLSYFAHISFNIRKDLHKLFNNYNPQLKYSEWPVFTLKPRYDDENYAACFTSDVKYEVEDILVRQLNILQNNTIQACMHMHNLLQDLYTVSDRWSPPLKLPPAFSTRVGEWLGGSEQLLQQVHQQHLVHVSMPMTGEYVVYNPLRSHRPQPTGATAGLAWVDQLARETEPGCDFCAVDNSTAEDAMGRHVTATSVRVSNTFKMERWHGLVVSRPFLHHPTRLPRRAFVAMMEDAVTLARDMMEHEPGNCFPHLAWDTLPHAGASQIHPHIHVLTALHSFYGGTELWRRAGEQYYRSTGRNLYSAVLELHRALGLAVSYRTATAIALLAGKGDLEVLLLSERPGHDLHTLLYFTVTAYQEVFKQFCYSLVASWHGDGPGCGTEGALPAVVRLVGRGDCTSTRTDYSSFEIFQAVYRSREPWVVARAVRETVTRNAGD